MITHAIASLVGLGISYVLPQAFDAVIRNKVNQAKAFLVAKIKAAFARKTK